jgi:hypothetical protein
LLLAAGQMFRPLRRKLGDVELFERRKGDRLVRLRSPAQ